MSDLVNFSPIKIIEEAYERAGLNLAMLTGRDLASAYTSFEMALIEIENLGLFHHANFNLVQLTGSLTASNNELTLQNGVHTLSTVQVTANDVTQSLSIVTLEELNDFAAAPDALPTHVAPLNTDPLTIRVYPSPDATTAFEVTGYTSLVAPSDVIAGVIPVPRLWYHALAATLAALVARKAPLAARDAAWMQTISLLDADKILAIKAAKHQTFNRGTITINPK